MINNSFKNMKRLWAHLCLPTKSIFIIGVTCFLSSAATIFHMTSFSDPSDIAIRSVMSSIFGFLFGDQIMGKANFKNKKFQTFVASAVSLGSLLIVILTQWIPVNQSGAALVEIRNLMFSSVGFLIGRSKSINSVELDDNNDKDKNKDP